MAVGDAPILGIPTSLIYYKGASLVTHHSADLISESMVAEHVLTDLAPLQGERDQNEDHNIVTHQTPGGSFVWRPRYSHLDAILELALGGGSTGAGWKPDTTVLEASTIQVVRNAQFNQTYSGCRFNELTILSEGPNPVQMEAGILAASCVESGSVSPVYTESDGIAPMMHNDLVLTDNIGASEKCYRYQLHIHNHLQEEGFANSSTRVHFGFNDAFEANLEIDIAFNSTTAALWGTYYDDTLGVRPIMKITATWTGASANLVIVFYGMITTPVPNVSGREAQIITIGLKGTADWAAGSLVAPSVLATVT